MSTKQINQIMDAVESQLSGKVLSYFRKNKDEYRAYATKTYRAAKKKEDVARKVTVPTIGEVNPPKHSQFYVGSIPATVIRKTDTTWDIEIVLKTGHYLDWTACSVEVENDFPYRTKPLPLLTFPTPTPDRWSEESTEKWLHEWADSAGINRDWIRLTQDQFGYREYRIEVPPDYVYQGRSADELSLEFQFLSESDVYKQKYGKAFKGMLAYFPLNTSIVYYGLSTRGDHFADW